jgi:GDP-D-mannose 3',5'-epimerase
MYPEHNQLDPDNPDCREESAYPATQTQNMDGKNFSLKDSTLLYSRNLRYSC